MSVHAWLKWRGIHINIPYAVCSAAMIESILCEQSRNINRLTPINDTTGILNDIKYNCQTLQLVITEAKIMM